MLQIEDYLNGNELTEELQSKIISAIKAVVQNYEWVNKAVTILDPYMQITKYPVDCVRQLLINQQEYNLINGTSNGSSIKLTHDEFFLELIPEIFKQMPILNLVGIQPIENPVDSVHYTVYDLPNDTLEIKSKTIEACSRKFTINIDVEKLQDGDVDYKDIKIKYASLLAKDLSNFLYYELIDKNVTDANDLSECKDLIKTINNDRIQKINVVLLSPNTLKSLGNLDEFENIQFIEDEYVLDDFIYLGYKGAAGEANAGFIFSPYITLMSTGIVLDPKTLEPKIVPMTRYGTYKTEQFADFYDVIQIQK